MMYYINIDVTSAMYLEQYLTIRHKLYNGPGAIEPLFIVETENTLNYLKWINRMRITILSNLVV